MKSKGLQHTSDGLQPVRKEDLSEVFEKSNFCIAALCFVLDLIKVKFQAKLIAPDGNQDSLWAKI